MRDHYLALLFFATLLFTALELSGAEVPDTSAYKFAEVEIPLIEFSEAHPIEVLNEIFANAHRSHPNLKDVAYSFTSQPGQMSKPTPLITGSYRKMAVAEAIREMTALCNWSFYIDGLIYKFTNSREFYAPKFWPELHEDTDNKSRD